MPRKSAAALTRSSVDGRPARLSPPKGLGKAEAAIFARIVGAVSAEHFKETDVDLLVRYCAAVVLAQRAGMELRRQPILNGKPSPWMPIMEKSERIMTTLALRLRICPQSRQHPRTTGRHAAGPSAPVDVSRFLEEYGDDDV